MRKHFILGLFLCFCFQAGYSNIQVGNFKGNSYKAAHFYTVASLKRLSVQNSFSSGYQGCCSWHGGIAACDTSVGRLVCQDGTYSPSCGC